MLKWYSVKNRNFRMSLKQHYEGKHQCGATYLGCKAACLQVPLPPCFLGRNRYCVETWVKLLEVDGHNGQPPMKTEENLLCLLAAWIGSCGVAKPGKIHKAGQEKLGGEASWGIWT